MLENLYELKQYLNQSGIFFCFSGPLSQSLVVEIGEMLKQKMRLVEAGASTMLKVFSVLVEQTQNMLHYSAEQMPRASSEGEGALKFGVIAVGYDQEQYFVMGGNLLENHQVEPLRDKLTSLRQMTPEELKQSYKEQRKKEPHADSKGAGLGFIEMARKSSRPLEFEFRGIDEQYSFFSIKITI